ncbi:MAG: phosphatidylglycerol lysyltransferase domain-containing protein [Synergistaceae bacterium]|jgi:hypothetical protein|nr:phosphatidylglycerol lysyltransferase domain-containing protein [Synergistaceae bacterium]
MLSFAPLTLADRERYSSLFARTPEKCSEYSFFALWGWNESDPVELAWTPDLCWIRSHGHREGLLAPVGDWDAVDWEDAFERVVRPEGGLLDVPESLAGRFPEKLKERLRFVELRNEWEYVYLVEALATLKGRKYDHKRTHVRSFVDNCNWEYVPLLPADFQELLAFQSAWCARRNCGENPLLCAEDQAIRRGIELWEQLPLSGALLRVDGRVVAYTIAEELSPDTIDIRFEKADNEHAGVYQALNRLFLERQGRDYHWVNREEDMGNTGLRDAKLSYHPDRFVKKFEVAFAEQGTG